MNVGKFYTVQSNIDLASGIPRRKNYEFLETGYSST